MAKRLTADEFEELRDYRAMEKLYKRLEDLAGAAYSAWQASDEEKLALAMDELGIWCADYHPDWQG